MELTNRHCSQGDSLTQNMDARSFAHRVGAAYSRKLDVLVRGYGGFNTAMGALLFDEIFARKGESQPGSSESSSVVRMVTLWFGGSIDADDFLPGQAPSGSQRVLIRLLTCTSLEDGWSGAEARPLPPASTQRHMCPAQCLSLHRAPLGIHIGPLGAHSLTHSIVGTNDSVFPNKPQHLSLSDFTSNLHTMLTNLTSPDSAYAVS
jgi:hypothetical protein